MQYLVMKNRILNLEHIAIYDIYKPMAHLRDKRPSVVASDLEKKIVTTIFKGSLKECQQFIDALGRMLNSDIAAMPVEVVLQAMQPIADEKNPNP